MVKTQSTESPSITTISNSTPLTISKFNKPMLNIPKSPVVPVTGSVTVPSYSEDDTEDQFVDKDGQQYRVRSMITDQQLSILKSKYNQNPRPASHELMEIGAQIGFPKRVVQVWFQNMRARDRRRGKVITSGSKVPDTAPPSLLNANDIITNATKTSGLTDGGYAAVPHLSYAATAGTGVYYAAAAQPIGVTPLYATTPTSAADLSIMGAVQVEPLDLSFKSSKPRTEPLPYRTVKPEPNTSLDDQVLNLSMKSSPCSDNEIKIELRTAPLSPISCVTSNASVVSNRHESGALYASTPGVPSPHSSMPAMSSPTHSEVTGSISLESSFNSAISLDSAGMENGACSLINIAKRARRQVRKYTVQYFLL